MKPLSVELACLLGIQNNCEKHIIIQSIKKWSVHKKKREEKNQLNQDMYQN